jgi:hypothetical protein
MKNVYAIKAFVALICITFGVLITNPVVNAETTCSPNSTAAAHTGAGNAANGDDTYCFATPQVLQMRFFEFGLCDGNASPSNRANCTPIFTSETGKVVNLSAGDVADLIDEVTLTEGTYSHGYLIVSNAVELNLTVEFSADRTDDDGNVGSICYTDGRKISSSSNNVAYPGNTSNSIISCGAQPNAVNSAETLTINGCGVGYTSSYPNFQYSAKGVPVTTDLYLVKSDSTLSDGCVNDHAFFAVQPFQDLVNITGNTNGLDVAVSLTGAVSMGFTNNAITAPNDVMFNGLQFIITSN